MSHRFFTLDVFTDTALAGNPLAVVLDAEGPSALAWTPRRMRSGPVSDLAIAVWAEP